MATPKPRRTSGEIEDIILCKIFHISLVESIKNDSTVVFLEMTAAEILREGKDLKFSRDLMERIVIDRLSGNFSKAEPPFQYLLNSYRRAHEEGKKIMSMTDENVRSEMEIVVKQAKQLVVSYCRIQLGNPDLFPNHDLDKSDVSPLLPLVFREVGKGLVGFGGSSEGISALPGFLDEFFRDSDYDAMEPILNKVFVDLSKPMLGVSALGNFKQPLRALLFLVKYPVGAKALVNHPNWIPESVSSNGRGIEMTSILGPFFHVSGLPDYDSFKSEPDVGQQSFSGASTGRKADRSSSFTTIKALMNNLYEGLAEVLMCLLKNTSTREHVLEYLAEVINRNSSRAHMQINPLSCASSGMFVNLSAVMLRLCEPFLDANLTKRDKIDPRYVFHSNRLELNGLTALHSSEEASETTREPSSLQNSSQASYPFICECFFMTARVLNLGLIKAISEFKHLAEDISRCENEIASLKAMQDQTSAPQLMQQHIARLENDIELYSKEMLCYEAQIVQDRGLLQRALSYYRLMVVWLVGRIGGFKMPLSPTCRMDFVSMPEHFVEDTMELLIFASGIPGALDGIMSDDFMSFIMMFMASPEYIRNPYLKAKMVEVLNYWSSLKATESLFEVNQLALDHLVRNLLKLYVDIEFTGSHSQFYDKFIIRHHIAALLEYLWQVPCHHNVWRKIAKEEEKGVYLNFLNFLINDSIYLLDESLKKILELKELEAEMSSTAEWERTQLLQSQENIIRIDMKLANENINMLACSSDQITAPFLLPEMVDRVASMLNYFLLKLVGPQRKSLRLKDSGKLEFQPKMLLKQIVKIYVNLARGDKDNMFAAAIARDGRSYNDEYFCDAADVLMRIGEDGRIVQEFIDLGEKAKAAAAEALDIEEALGEVPDEFLDPIQYTLMKDPVVLPSSKVTLDRPVIQRHLLSDSTDPFNRSHLTADMLIPDFVMKAKIEEFIKSHESKR